MANKDRNKRSARQARQRERAKREALAAEQSAKEETKRGKRKAAAQAPKKTPAKVASGKGAGLITRTRAYFGAVRGEMRRVTWPSRTELTDYAVAVIAALVISGVAVWLVDTGIVAALVGFTGLRG